MTSQQPHRALVTGAAGFLGSHMVDHLLALGYDVIGVDNLQAGVAANVPDNPRLLFIVGDVRQRDWWPQLEGRLDRIFHYAANASVPFSTTDPEYDCSTNILGTLAMLDLARATGARLTFISSAAIYGTPDVVPTPESHGASPISVYGVSKLAGEGLVRFYATNHDVDTRIVRYFNCYGPRQPRYVLFDYLTRAEQRDGPFEVLGTGAQRRTQLFCTDAVRAAHLISERGDSAPYNVGSSEVYTVLDIATQVLTVTGQPDRRIVTTGTSWPGDIQVLQPSLARVRALGWAPTVTLSDGLAEVYRWWNDRPQKSVLAA